MNWMVHAVSFIALDFINPLGLDVYILPKAWALSFLVLYYETHSTRDVLESLLCCAAAAFVLALSYDWATSVLGCELLGFQGLVQAFIYYEVFKMSKGCGDISKIVLLFSIPMFTYGIIQHIGGMPRALSTQGNPVFLSVTSGILSPLILHDYRQSKNPREAWGSVSILFLFIGCLWAARAKCGILASIVGVTAYLWF